MAKLTEINTEFAIPTEAILNYTAGFFDGEGSTVIVYRQPRSHHQKPAIDFTVKISQVDIRPLELIQKYFGGRIQYDSRVRENLRWQGIHTLIFNSNFSARFLEIILPYLIVKKDSAQFALLIWNNRKAIDLEKAVKDFRVVNNFGKSKSKDSERELLSSFEEAN